MTSATQQRNAFLIYVLREHKSQDTIGLVHIYNLEINSLTSRRVMGFR